MNTTYNQSALNNWAGCGFAHSNKGFPVPKIRFQKVRSKVHPKNNQLELASSSWVLGNSNRKNNYCVGE